MNKFKLLAFFLTMLHQTHTGQASDTSESFTNLSNQQKRTYLNNLGFLEDDSCGDFKIIISPTGSTFRLTNNEITRIERALPCGTNSTDEYQITQYSNGVQYKQLHDGREFVRKPGYDGWQLVPAQFRHLIN